MVAPCANAGEAAASIIATVAPISINFLKLRSFPKKSLMLHNYRERFGFLSRDCLKSFVESAGLFGVC